MMRAFFYFWSLLCCLANTAQAQFTRQDSLRGSLSALRTCYDVHYYDLSLTVYPDQRFIQGFNDIHFKANTSFETLQIDLFENMAITAITWEGQSLSFEREGNATFVSFPRPLAQGSLSVIRVAYEGKPTVAINAPWDGGFTWAQDAEGKPWIGVSCEGIGASLWWPNKDHLSEEPDSMRIRCAVPQGLMCVANGRLRGTQQLENDLVQFDWFVSYPINNYNVTLNIANYAHFEDVYEAADGDRLTLDFFVLPKNLEKAQKQLGTQTKPMLACFEQYFGKYPFWNDGYKVVETPYLGMEHQSAIAYGNGYKNGYLGSDLSGSGVGLKFDYILIHESGHEYWGNNVSCDDHAEMWIHESWCTYSEVVYVECMFGKAAADAYVNGYRYKVENRKPLIAPLGVNADAPGDIYFKGALMLHTLRHVVDNDALWWATVKNIQSHFRHQVINTQQLIDFMSKQLGADYQYFFDQYLYQAKLPELEIQALEGKGYRYRWANCVPDFRMPIKAKINGKTQTLTPTTVWQTLPKATSVKPLMELYYIK
ncbi:M1 family metallopeptidase [Eisenibacter elegans]|uniref:M1 family metallopeptidase n=1 Tax=Eisenibacter elegans TaxID=997 RepID=UPI001378E0CF|nr:M1 family metallopeptidase [Eisenibacter elegans]